MDKQYFTPWELINIATQHAYCADNLLSDNAELTVSGYGVCDTLNSVVSLIYMAFELTLKAYLLHDHNKNTHHKNLMELLEQSDGLGLANEDRQLLKTLSRQYAFRKGTNYDLWDTREQLYGFCIELIQFYERLQAIMPLELQNDYQ